MAQLTDFPKQRKVRQRGMMLIEFLASMLIGMFSLAGIVGILNWYLDYLRENSAADYQANIAKAVENYIRQNYVAIAQSPGPMTLKDIQNKGYVPNFPPKNIYGNTPCILIGKNADDPKQIVALVVFKGGQTLPEIDLGVIASMAGMGGGFIPSASMAIKMANHHFADRASADKELGIGPGSKKSKYEIAYGAYSSWALSMRHFHGGTSCVNEDIESRPASLIYVDKSKGDPEFLARAPSNANNAMETDLNINGNNINNVGTTSVDYPMIQGQRTIDDACDESNNEGRLFLNQRENNLVMCKKNSWLSSSWLAESGLLAKSAFQNIKSATSNRTLTWRDKSGTRNDMNSIDPNDPNSQYNPTNPNYNSADPYQPDYTYSGTSPTSASSVDVYCHPNEIVEYVRFACTDRGEAGENMNDEALTQYSYLESYPIGAKKPLFLKNQLEQTGKLGKGGGWDNGWKPDNGTGAGWAGSDKADGWGVDMEDYFNADMHKTYGFFSKGRSIESGVLVRGAYVEGWHLKCGSYRAYVGLACRAISGDAIPATDIRIDPDNNLFKPSSAAQSQAFPPGYDVPSIALPKDGILKPPPQP